MLLPERASWLEDFKAELLSFPNARYDDQVDALSQFLDWNSVWRQRGRIRSEREEMQRKRGVRKEGTPRRGRRLTWYDGVSDHRMSNEGLLANHSPKRLL